MARPTKLTKKMIDELCKVIENGGSNVDACSICMLNQSTFYLWLNRAQEDIALGKNTIYVEFFNRLKTAESKCKMAHLQVINRVAIKGDTWQASAWLLERKFPKEFARTDRLAIAKDEDNGMMKEILNAVNKMGINDLGDGNKD